MSWLQKLVNFGKTYGRKSVLSGELTPPDTNVQIDFYFPADWDDEECRELSEKVTKYAMDLLEEMDFTVGGSESQYSGNWKNDE